MIFVSPPPPTKEAETRGMDLASLRRRHWSSGALGPGRLPAELRRALGSGRR